MFSLRNQLIRNFFVLKASTRHDPLIKGKKQKDFSNQPGVIHISQSIYVVDAFAHKAFTGNPAAICILSSSESADWMQQVAAEMNLSETAFLQPIEDGYHLRWFTPLAEVDLCGHATLASAHILWETGLTHPKQPIRFHTKSGILTAYKKNDWIKLDFPSEAPTFVDTYPQALIDGLGVDPISVGRNQSNYIIEVPSEEMVKEMTPNFSLLQTIEARGFLVTSRSADHTIDFISRCFFPSIGIPEDPVTGSAHCCLGPYWAYLLNKTELYAYQASKRGGFLKVRLHNNRVHLFGQAITVLKSELLY